MSQRGITEDDIALVIEKGVKMHKAGAIFFFMRHKDISKKEEEHLLGLTVCLARDQRTVKTVYKNRVGLQAIKRKKNGMSKATNNEITRSN